jgi:hypothetical protein
LDFNKDPSNFALLASRLLPEFRDEPKAVQNTQIIISFYRRGWAADQGAGAGGEDRGDGWADLSIANTLSEAARRPIGVSEVP